MVKTNKELALDFLKEQAKNEQNTTLASYYQEAVDAISKLIKIEKAIDEAKEVVSSTYVPDVVYADLLGIL